MIRFLTFSLIASSLPVAHLAAAESSESSPPPPVSRTLEDCGRYLAALAHETFAIDAATQNDIDVDKLVYAVLVKNVSTQLGRARLHWLLRHTGTNAEEILTRQRAVRYLVEHADARARLKQMLAAVDKAASEGVDKDLYALVAHNGWMRNLFDNAKSVTSAGTMGGVTTSVALGFAPPNSLMTLLYVPAIMAMGEGIKREDQERQRIRSFVPMIQILDRSREILAASDSSTLTSLAAAFDRLLDPAGSDNLLALKSAFDGLWNPRISDFGSILMFTNAFTARLRRKVVAHLPPLETLASAIGELDVLVALAEDAAKGKVFPEILPNAATTTLSIVKGHHPWVLEDNFERSVANDLELNLRIDGSAPAAKFAMLTGPNTGGKSTYLKMIASLILIAQMGGAVPAEAMTLTPLAVLSNIKTQDILEKGESSFYAQAKRVVEILNRAANPEHVFILMDEILTGTSPEEHTAIEQAIIKYLVDTRAIAILATHDRKLQQLADIVPGVYNIHVDDKASAMYRVLSGPSRTRNALEVLREVGMPEEILSEAQRYLDARDLSDAALDTALRSSP